GARRRRRPRAKHSPRPRATRRQRSNGEDITGGSTVPNAQVQVEGLQPLPALRAAARLLPQVRALPPLPAGARPQGLHPRHDQVELVIHRDMLTDPISDYLTRVRNALAAQHADVEIPASRLKKEMTRI